MENRITEAMTYMIEQNKRSTDTKQAVINAANSYEYIKTAQKIFPECMAPRELSCGRPSRDPP